MPELPEVEHLRRTLVAGVVGRGVVRARLFRRDVLVRAGDPAGGFARAGERPGSGRGAGRVPRGEMLGGQGIVDVIRHGKQLALVADSGRVLCVHLGMSGQVLHVAPGADGAGRSHVHASWVLDDGSRLLYRDPRRFGGLWAFESVACLRASRWDALGPDALSITPRVLHGRLARTSRAIKGALLDQSLIAGVGNIYADEALFACGINPWRSASSVSRDEAAGLARALRRTLGAAIRAGGSTLRDYADARGRAGAFQLRHRVYGRGGLACSACSMVLASGVIAQRTTVWCPRCQPAACPHLLHTGLGALTREASLSLCKEEG